MSDRATLLTNVYTKLDQLPLEFGIDPDNLEKGLGGDLNDTLREMKLYTADNVQQDQELYVEVRSVWYALRRFRNSTLVHFKYSTGSDGKSVDKSMIPKAISMAMEDYAAQFKDWRGTRSTGSLWNRGE